MTGRKLKLPPAWMLNVIQIALAIGTIIASVYYSTLTNKYGNESWKSYETAMPLLENADDAWEPNKALDPSISKPAFQSLIKHFQASGGIMNNLEKTLLVWLFVAGVPLLVSAWKILYLYSEILN